MTHFVGSEEEETLLNGCCVPENFIQCFVDYAVQLKHFLKAMLEFRENNDSIVWNTILELYLRKDLLSQELPSAKTPEIDAIYEQEVMSILTDPRAAYDCDQALVLVQMHDFKKGQVFLYEKYKMYSMLVKHFASTGETDRAIETCKRVGKEEPSLWLQLLSNYAEMKAIDMAQLTEVLSYLYENEIVTPLMAFQVLAKNKAISLGMLKKLLVRCMQEKAQMVEEDREKVTQLQESVKEMEAEIVDVKTYPSLAMGSS